MPTIEATEPPGLSASTAAEAVLGLLSAGLQARHLGLLWIFTEAVTLAAVPLLHFNGTPRAFEASKLEVSASLYDACKKLRGPLRTAEAKDFCDESLEVNSIRAHIRTFALLLYPWPSEMGHLGPKLSNENLQEDLCFRRIFVPWPLGCISKYNLTESWKN